MQIGNGLNLKAIVNQTDSYGTIDMERLLDSEKDLRRQDESTGVPCH